MMIIKDCEKCGKDYMYDANDFKYEKECQECVDEKKEKNYEMQSNQ